MKYQTYLQYRLNIELDEYTKADHEYHVHVNTVLNFSRKIGDIFESSESKISASSI